MFGLYTVFHRFVVLSLVYTPLSLSIKRRVLSIPLLVWKLFNSSPFNRPRRKSAPDGAKVD